jgi:hypothetical protein
MSISRSLKRVQSALLSPFKAWWKGQRDRHLAILGSTSFIGFSLLMWAVVFFFFLDGAADPELADWVSNTWFGLLIGVTLLIFAAPEFFHYQAQCSFLLQILDTTSRADIGRQRKEAQEAATLLGSVWTARLEAHLIEVGVTRSRGTPDDADKRAPEDLLIRWWTTKDSNLSRMSAIDGLRNPIINRTIGSIGFTMMLLQLCNMAFGLVRNAAGDRVNTLVIWDWLTGVRIDSVPSPYYDDISGWFLLLVSTALFWASFPASGERNAVVEEEE